MSSRIGPVDVKARLVNESGYLAVSKDGRTFQHITDKNNSKLAEQGYSADLSTIIKRIKKATSTNTSEKILPLQGIRARCAKKIVQLERESSGGLFRFFRRALLKMKLNKVIRNIDKAIKQIDPKKTIDSQKLKKEAIWSDFRDQFENKASVDAFEAVFFSEEDIDWEALNEAIDVWNQGVQGDRTAEELYATKYQIRHPNG